MRSVRPLYHNDRYVLYLLLYIPTYIFIIHTTLYDCVYIYIYIQYSCRIYFFYFSLFTSSYLIFYTDIYRRVNLSYHLSQRQRVSRTPQCALIACAQCHIIIIIMCFYYNIVSSFVPVQCVYACARVCLIRNFYRIKLLIFFFFVLFLTCILRYSYRGIININ